MPVEDNKRAIHQRLVNRILHGPGQAPAEQRVRAFENAEPIVLLEKVATRSVEVTDADFSDAGLTDDQLFELAICAAVGAATRQYEAGLAALRGAE